MSSHRVFTAASAGSRSAVAVARDQRARLVGRRAPAPRKNTTSARPPRRQLDHGLQGARTDRARRRPGPTSGLRAPGAAGWSSVPFRPRNSVRSPVHAVCDPRGRRTRRDRRSRRSTGCARTARPCPRSISVTMTGAVALRDDAQHPFDVRGHRQPPGLGRTGSRSSGGRSSPGRPPARTGAAQDDAVGRVLEAAVALTVPGDVGRRVLPDGQRGRAPQRRRSPRPGRR